MSTRKSKGNTAAAAADVLERFHDRFAGPALPVPVDEIAEDLLGLLVDEDDPPSSRRELSGGDEPRETATDDDDVGARTLDRKARCGHGRTSSFHVRRLQV